MAPDTNVRHSPDGDLWRPGDAPTQAARWAVESVAKAGTIGVYPPQFATYPFAPSGFRAARRPCHSDWLTDRETSAGSMPRSWSSRSSLASIRSSDSFDCEEPQ